MRRGVVPGAGQCDSVRRVHAGELLLDGRVGAAALPGGHAPRFDAHNADDERGAVHRLRRRSFLSNGGKGADQLQRGHLQPGGAPVGMLEVRCGPLPGGGGRYRLPSMQKGTLLLDWVEYSSFVPRFELTESISTPCVRH